MTMPKDKKLAAPIYYDATVTLTNSRVILWCCTGEKGTKEVAATPVLHAIAGRAKVVMRPASQPITEHHCRCLEVQNKT